VAAVEAGEIAKAKQIYPKPRVDYERIEPVAESFGDLDPRIDARENDVSKSEFGGFHRIEKALWEEDTTQGMAPVAEGLQEDVEELEEKIKGDIKIQAVEIANGANELLTEVSTSKITGEEERYSHIDLVDFLANVEGSQVAFESVAPLIAKKQPQLVGEVAAGYEAVYTALKQYETKQWPGFVLYTELNKSDTRELAQVIDALAEKSALIPAQIAKGETA
jgi:iron uptake system component EfeO